jgi:hypothetical protein
MTFSSVDPSNGERLREYPAWGPAELERALERGAAAAAVWAGTSVAARCALLARAIPKSGEQLPVIGIGTWGEPVFYAKHCFAPASDRPWMDGLVGAPGMVEWADSH